nr:hypothetical protein [uncultured Desulfobacter sp.]
MEQARLSLLMPEKRITLCEDETFHPQVCLVAIEPNSNYIILEKYAKDRSGATWNQSVGGALGNLPVKVIQSTSDEGKGLIHHVTKGLNSHHSPDLFHVMYEISRGTGAPLSSKIRKAEKEHENSKKNVLDAQKNKADYETLKNDLLVDLLILIKKSFSVWKKNKKQGGLWTRQGKIRKPSQKQEKGSEVQWNENVR